MKKETWRIRRNNGLGRIGVDAVEARKNGVFYQSGNEYRRQQPLTNIITGKNTKVSFAFDVVVDAEYAIISADDIQPSHLGSIENPYHFIPEAQPRNRAISESGATVPIRIAENLRPAEICEGSTAYAGCSVVNTRGEVIQGSGRGFTMKYYWDNFPNDPKGYTDYLVKSFAQYGIKRSDLAEIKSFNKLIFVVNDRPKIIKNPVLVRIVDCSDTEAIRLGQYKQSDLEAISTKSNEIKSRVNLIDDAKLSRILESAFSQSFPDDSLSEIIRKTNILSQLIKIGAIRADQIEEFEKNGQINARGVQYVSDILLNLIFKGSDTNIPEIFSQLPLKIQNSIVKSTPYLLRVDDNKSLKKEVSKSIIATRDFLSSGNVSIKEWKSQPSMFSGTPKDEYSEFELKLVDIFTTAKAQSDIVKYFQQYARLVADVEADLISPAKKGESKENAISLIFLGREIPKEIPKVSKIRIAQAKLKLAKARLNLAIVFEPEAYNFNSVKVVAAKSLKINETYIVRTERFGELVLKVTEIRTSSLTGIVIALNSRIKPQVEKEVGEEITLRLFDDGNLFFQALK